MNILDFPVVAVPQREGLRLSSLKLRGEFFLKIKTNKLFYH